MPVTHNVQSMAKQFIFEDDRPFQSCHASTLVVLHSGDVLAAWFGGSYEKASDVAIWLSRRSGDAWSAPYKIADEEGIAHWNPVLYAEGQKIWLFYKVGHEIPTWFTRIMRSDNGGFTWSEPEELVPGDIGGRGPVRSKPIRLSGGSLLAPASVERRDSETPGKEIWEAYVDISTDSGETWTRSAIVPMNVTELIGTQYGPSKGLIQPTLWSLDGLNVYMLLRSTEGLIFRSDSVDGGFTWCTAYPSGLPNNNCGIDVVLMDKGKLALAYNPVSGFTTDSPRTPLVIRFSSDNGFMWEDEVVLEDGPGEFSYPAMVCRGNDLYITYTWNRERIVFRRLTMEPK